METTRAARRRPTVWLLALLPLVIAGAAVGWWLSPGQVQYRKDRELKKAVSAGGPAAIAEELGRGANVNARYKNGLRPLMYAAKGDRPSKKHPAKSDHPEAVALLLEKGAEPNAKADSGATALFWAARYGHVKAAKALLEHGADPNVRDSEGMTPLKWATENEQTPVIELLKKAGEKE